MLAIWLENVATIWMTQTLPNSAARAEAVHAAADPCCPMQTKDRTYEQDEPVRAARWRGLMTRHEGAMSADGLPCGPPIVSPQNEKSRIQHGEQGRRRIEPVFA